MSRFTILLQCLCLLLTALPLPAVQRKQKEVLQAEQNARENAAHDARSDNTNISYCNTLSASNDKKYRDGKEFYEAYSNQLINQINQQHRSLVDAGKMSDHLEALVNRNAGDQFNSSMQQQAVDINAQQKQLLVEIEQLKNKKPVLEQELRQLRSQLAYSDPYSNQHANLIANIDQKEAEIEYNDILIQQRQREHDYMGGQLKPIQGNIIASQASMEAADRANQRGAFAYSGCDYDEATGDCPLSGPLYEQNEQLKKIAQQGVGQAIRFAKLQHDRLNLAELKNSHNSDYKLYEALLSDKDSPEARRTLASNIDIAAKMAAAAKNLECKPAGEHDSKAYHLYRGAAAVFLTALINDTTYYGDTAADCRADEMFTRDPSNEQINSLERVTNLHEALFANLCLRTEPEDPVLQEKCREHVTKIFGNNPEYLDMPLTRENALMMFKAAHKAAVTELKNKWLQIKTANEQIKKGKERIKEYKRLEMLAFVASLAAMALKLHFKAKAAACAAATGCNPAPFIAQAKKWEMIEYALTALSFYFKTQVWRWEKFVKKWKKKLAKARVYTHLDCSESEKEAKKETAQVEDQAQRAKEELKKEIEQQKNELLQRIHQTLADPPATSSLFMLLFPAAYAAPRPHATTQATGIRYGSWSFQQFILKRNREWFLLSQDVNPFLTWPADHQLYPLAFLDEEKAATYQMETLQGMLKPLSKSIDGKTDYTNRPMEFLGFPLPETRVMSTARTIRTIEKNLKNTKDTLKTVADQLDEYKKLLKKSKERLPLKDKGLVEAPSRRAIKKVHCASGEGANLQFDSNCACRKGSSCAQFNFPEFGDITGPGEYNLVEGVGNDILAGKLKSANLKGAKLKKKSAIYANSTLSLKPDPAASKKGRKNRRGSGPGNASAFNPSHSSPSSGSAKSAGTSGGNKTPSLSSSASSTGQQSSSDEEEAGSANRTAGSAVGVLEQNRFARFSSSGMPFGRRNSLFDDLDDDEDGPTGGSKYSGSQGSDASSSSSEENLIEKGASATQPWNNRDIAASQKLHDRMSRLFKIVSRRYRKSAYPRLIKKNNKLR